MRSTSRPNARSSATGSTRPLAKGTRVALVASQFHAAISHALILGATRVLRRNGVAASHVRLVWAPGAFELPVVAARLVRRRPRPDAVIALGALIRGETPQYEVIARAVAQGLEQLAVRTGIPVAFGVIIATTLAQATARAGGAMGNRGEEAALAALAVLKI